MTASTTRKNAATTTTTEAEPPHQLPALPYDAAALEPWIDARTMTLHHGKHHASYVEKLNTALEKYPELQQKTPLWLLLNAAKLPADIREGVHDNAGGHLNHSLFWQAMSPAGGGVPVGPLADAIKRDFGSFDAFRKQFDQAGGAVFGSGWVWLVKAADGSGRLEIVVTAGHDNPQEQGRYPVLLNDVWEHAYYLKHENRRPDYLEGWWNIVDWPGAARRYASTEPPAEAD